MYIEKYQALRGVISGLESAILAFSGGVDSSLLAYICHDLLKDRFVAVTVRSMVVSAQEIDGAKKIADNIGCSHKIIEIDLSSRQRFIKNSKNRCYWCKKEIFKALRSYAHEFGTSNIIEGSNTDDLSDYRPGTRAVKESGAIQPYMLASVNKKEIRDISEYLHLCFSKKPSMACLATRIAYDEKIDIKKLYMVETAESFLKGLVKGNLRVRYHSCTARIEVDKNDMQTVLENSDRICRMFAEIGFKYTALDLGGFRSGSMNEAL